MLTPLPISLCFSVCFFFLSRSLSACLVVFCTSLFLCLCISSPPPPALIICLGLGMFVCVSLPLPPPPPALIICLGLGMFVCVFLPLPPPPRGDQSTCIAGDKTKDFINTARSVSCRYLRAQFTWRLERKNRKQWSCFFLTSSVLSHTSPARCTLWEGVWLAKNFARVKYRLKFRAQLSCLSTFFGITPVRTSVSRHHRSEMMSHFMELDPGITLTSCFVSRKMCLFLSAYLSRCLSLFLSPSVSLLPSLPLTLSFSLNLYVSLSAFLCHIYSLSLSLAFSFSFFLPLSPTHTLSFSLSLFLSLGSSLFLSPDSMFPLVVSPFPLFRCGDTGLTSANSFNKSYTR